MNRFNPTEFSTTAANLMREIYSKIVPILNLKADRKIDLKINYAVCEVKIVNDDHSTVWVKWGDKYNCKFENLPLTAMATITDEIICSEIDFKKA